MARRINAPGIEVNEIDRSAYDQAVDNSTIGTTTLVMGFADKGDDYNVKWINTANTFTRTYGNPTNEAEKYFYNAAMEIINGGGTCFAAKLPYYNNSLDNFTYTSYTIDSKAQYLPSAMDIVKNQISGLYVTVKLNPNGGTLISDEIRLKVGGEFGNLPVPERSSYKFVGWFMGDTQISSTTKVDKSYGFTISARWENMWSIFTSNLENFDNQDLTTLSGDIEENDVKEGKLPAPGSFIPVKYKISSDSFVDTQFQVLGYNGSIPEYVKYKSESGDLIYVKSIGEGGFLSSIANGVSAFSDKNGSGYIGLVDNVSEETFRYGQANQDWGISATESGSYDVPMNLTVDSVQYTFAGYNMTIMPRYALRTSVDETAYNLIYFSKNGSSPKNRWTTSEIRSWMNGTGSSTGATWYSESGSTTSTSVPGLLDRFEPVMLGSVSKAVNRTFVYNGSVDHAVDTFWLPGRSNINASEDVSFPDCKNDTCKFSTAFENTDASRKRYFMDDTGASSGLPCFWWLRSALSGVGHVVGRVYYDGYVGDSSASSGLAVLPVCLIG